MADENDIRGMKSARRELARRGIETSKCDVRMSHGVLYLRGLVGKVHGSPIKNLESEVELIGRLLKQKPEIRDVVIDCKYQG